ncbi:ribbon-helix-helix domain-containing protein [Sphingobium boeckii]|uniref:Antitoxin ParD1/3/4 n=1 Tax=Sphingobium boeckii TaxID=1082345 RepID=A0A7W9AK33_9SPHN|nr:type II toxin-antitoxin system ParD family antitoxin [Sphingobium boeckii]MBB5687143.1 antitoxin ParD1/3/4 [Sphingobium boeckii]
MNISLPDEMKARVEERVKSGVYADVSDYVRDLIRDDLSDPDRWISPNIASIIEDGEESEDSEKTLEQIFAEAKSQYRSS